MPVFPCIRLSIDHLTGLAAENIVHDDRYVKLVFLLFIVSLLFGFQLPICSAIVLVYDASEVLHIFVSERTRSSVNSLSMAASEHHWRDRRKTS